MECYRKIGKKNKRILNICVNAKFYNHILCHRLLVYKYRTYGNPLIVCGVYAVCKIGMLAISYKYVYTLLIHVYTRIPPLGQKPPQKPRQRVVIRLARTDRFIRKPPYN